LFVVGETVFDLIFELMQVGYVVTGRWLVAFLSDHIRQAGALTCLSVAVVIVRSSRMTAALLATKYVVSLF
jgi:hypothetical protein